MSVITVALLAAGMAIAVSDTPPVATSDAPPGPPHVAILATPSWTRLPSADEFASLYPRPAAQQGIGGRVRLGCRVMADGSLSTCEIVAETPSGNGFGDAALKAAKYFRMKPTIPSGQSVAGALVTIPLTFSPPSR